MRQGGPSMAAIDGPAGPPMAIKSAMDGPAGPVVVGDHLQRDKPLRIQNPYLFIDCSMENGAAVIYWKGREW